MANLRQPDATTRDDLRTFQNTPREARLNPVNAPEKAIEWSCPAFCLGRSFLASLATAQGQIGLTAARPVSRRNGEGENHGQSVCARSSVPETQLCARGGSQGQNKIRGSEQRDSAQSVTETISRVMSLFSADPKTRPWRSLFSFLFFSFLVLFFPQLFRRGSSPFTPAVVYPESFISLAHSLAALRRMSAPKMPATEVTPLLRGGGGSEGGSGSSSLWSTDGEALSVTPVDAPDDESAGANKWRIAATFYGFFIVGATDGAYGVRRFPGLVVLIS